MARATHATVRSEVVEERIGGGKIDLVRRDGFRRTRAVWGDVVRYLGGCSHLVVDFGVSRR
jgi:hypothetical protein